MIAAAPPKAAAGKLFRQAVMHGIRRPQPTAPPQNSRLVLPEMRLSAPAAAPGVPESAVRTKAKSTKASPPCTAQPAACSQRGDSASSFPAAARISINPTAQASPEKIQSTGIAAVVQSGTPTARVRRKPEYAVAATPRTASKASSPQRMPRADPFVSSHA